MTRRWLVLMLALFALALPTASSAQPSKPAPAAIGKAHAAGDAVFVEWGGSWWKATVIAPLADGRSVIHYDGWSDDYDEVAKPRRLRTPLVGQPTPVVGEAVFVEWDGSWWPAKVLKVGKGSHRITYDGYGPEWDEDVGPARLIRLSPPEG